MIIQQPYVFVHNLWHNIMDFKNLRQQRLVKYIDDKHHGNIRECSIQNKIDYSSLHKYYHGTKLIGDGAARGLCEKLKLPQGYLDSNHEIRTVKSKMLIVPLMKFKVCASGGIEAWSEEVDGELQIPEIVAQRKKINVRNLISIEVAGDCMSPTYNNGDFIFVDKSYSDPTTIINNRVYVVKYNFELSLKRLEKFPEHIVMKSDNPNKILYHDKNTVANVPFDIVGLVVYSMGE